jgi:hypothetical protein
MSVVLAWGLTVHPRLRLDLREPVLDCGNAAKIFPDVLLAYIADRNLFSLAVHDGNAEQLLGEKNTFGMMMQSSMAEIRKESL